MRGKKEFRMQILRAPSGIWRWSVLDRFGESIASGQAGMQSKARAMAAKVQQKLYTQFEKNKPKQITFDPQYQWANRMKLRYRPKNEPDDGLDWREASGL